MNPFLDFFITRPIAKDSFFIIFFLFFFAACLKVSMSGEIEVFYLYEETIANIVGVLSYP